jgi:hypothetical protein
MTVALFKKAALQRKEERLLPEVYDAMLLDKYGTLQDVIIESAKFLDEN